MLRKLLGAALAVAMMLSLSAGAFGADMYFAAEGGGGGGGAGTPSGGGGRAGGLTTGETNVNNLGNAGGAGGALGTIGGAGGAGSRLGTGREVGPPPFNEDPWGDLGAGGAHLNGGSRPYFEIDLDTNTPGTGGGNFLHILGGNGGDAGTGTGNPGENGGSGGDGGDGIVGLTGSNVVDYNINIFGGDGGKGGVNTVGGATETTPGRMDGSHGGGGRGGDMAVEAVDDLTVDGAVTITVKGGTAGEAQGGRNGSYGGSASFKAGTVILGNSALGNAARINVINGVGAANIGLPSPSKPEDPKGGDVTVGITKLVAGIGGGVLTTANGTADNGSGGGEGLRNISIGSIDALLGDMTLNFTDIDLGNGDIATFGDVAVGEGMTFDVAAGVQDTNFIWTGDLTTFNNVTVNGLDASGKRIKMMVDDTYDFLTGPIVSGSMVVGTSAADTAAVTLNVDKNHADAIKLHEEDPTVVINVFDSGISGEEFLEDQKLNIVSGGYRGSVLFANDGTTQAGTLVMTLGEDAYNALLAAPALMSLVNGGADAVERAAGSFSPMALIGGNVGTQFGVFASMGAASMDVDTGSGIESDSFHLLVGPGLRINSGTGRTDIGAFFEAGWGSFDTFNSVYRGEGDSEYYGGGLLLRHDTCFGLYAEASVRFGTADAEYVRRDIDTDYDLDSSYVGGHLGLGYIFRPSDASSFDVFAKALATRVNDDSAVDDAGYTIDVDSTNSFRTQLGAKYSYNFCDAASFYVKGVWEHEFNGETAGRYDGDVIVGKPDSSGSSVIGELGVDWRLAERVSVGAGVYGVAGQREGFGGNLSIGIGF